MSIHDNEEYYLKVLMDEVFGRGNFIDTVIWEKADSPRNSARQLSSDHDYIFANSREKRNIGARLQEVSGGSLVFL